MKNTTHVDFSDTNPNSVRFVEINSMRAVGEHLKAKYFVDQTFSNSVDEPTLVRKNQVNKIKVYSLTKTNSNTLDTQAFHDKKSQYEIICRSISSTK